MLWIIFIINKVIFIFYLIGALILNTIHIYKAKSMNIKDKEYRNQREKLHFKIRYSSIKEIIIKMLNAKKPFLKEMNKNIDELTNRQFELRNTDMNYNFLTASTNAIIQFLLIVTFSYLLLKSYLTISAALILYNYKK